MAYTAHFSFSGYIAVLFESHSQVVSVEQTAGTGVLATAGPLNSLTAQLALSHRN